MVTEPGQRQHQEGPGFEPIAVEPFQVGPYRIGWKLGEGGMGYVFLGHHHKNGKAAAVKLLRPELLKERRFRRRFRREVKAARRVPGTFTARVLDAEPDDEPPWVATEYIEAPSLHRVLREQGPLAGAELERFALGVATALREIHARGVIHRDLKPANVLLPGDGPRVIDFGIARFAESATETVTSDDHVVGTLPYMAPEQLRNGSLTASTDVFAWGSLVTAAATGRPPFGTGYAAQVSILTGEPDLGDLDEPLRGSVAQALRKRPDLRPSAADLVRRLSPDEPDDTKVEIAGPPGRRRKALAAGAVALGLVVVATVVTWGARQLMSNPCRPLDGQVTIGVFNGWEEGVAASFLWAAALERRGADVRTVFDDIDVVYDRVAGSDYDLAFDAWLPRTHGGYWEEHDGQLEDLHAWYEGANLTVVVDYGAPIESLSELADAADEFNNVLLGIEAGAGLTRIIEEEVIPTYGLEGMRFVPNQTEDMLAVLADSIARGEHAVATLWRPHRAYLDLDPHIRDLRDPEGVLGREENIHAFARPGFAEDRPLIADWVMDFTMSNDDLIDLEQEIARQQAADRALQSEAGVRAWLETRPGYLSQLTPIPECA